jgi:hypothetical protein
MAGVSNTLSSQFDPVFIMAAEQSQLFFVFISHAQSASDRTVSSSYLPGSLSLAECIFSKVSTEECPRAKISKTNRDAVHDSHFYSEFGFVSAYTYPLAMPDEGKSSNDLVSIEAVSNT